jgi:hypothetical protein
MIVVSGTVKMEDVARLPGLDPLAKEDGFGRRFDGVEIEQELKLIDVNTLYGGGLESSAGCSEQREGEGDWGRGGR